MVFMVLNKNSEMLKFTVEVMERRKGGDLIKKAPQAGIERAISRI